MKHESHTWAINRLKRADGHPRKVVGMIKGTRFEANHSSFAKRIQRRLRVENTLPPM